MVVREQMMTNSDFLAEVYGPFEPGQYGWVTHFAADPNNAPPTVWGGRMYAGTPNQAALIDHATQDNVYFCTAILQPTIDAEIVRRKDGFARLAALVVDDVQPDDVHGCSWVMQTSPGKFQVGILLDADDADTHNRDLVDRVMSALAARGRSNDASGNACVRYVRCPGGTNTKLRAAGAWRVELEQWSPNVRWSLADAAHAVGIDLDGLRMSVALAKASPGTSQSGTHAGEMIAGLTAPPSERVYHENITRLAANLVAGGMFPGNAVEFLYSLMDSLRPGDQAEMARWDARRAEIPRAVKSAEKFAPENRQPPKITVNLDLAPDATPPDPSLRPLDWVQLGAVTPEPTNWRYEGWLPERTVTLLSANGGVGKSNLSLQLAVSLAIGRDLFGVSIKQSRVLILSGEDESRTVHFRVANVCADAGVELSALTNHLIVYDLTQQDCVLFRSGAPTERMQWLADATVRHRADVVIIDNASDVYADNENDRACVRGFMRCLNIISSSTGAAMLLLAHVDKASVRGGAGLDTNTTFSGSTAWNNSARSRWAMVRDDAAVILRHEKCNLGPLQDEIRLEFDAAAKVFKAYGAGLGNHVTATLMRKQHRVAILQLIERATACGTNLSMKVNAPTTNIYNVLRNDPEFPRIERKEFFRVVRDLENDNLIEQVEYRKSNRTTGQRVALTTAGISAAQGNSDAPPGWLQRHDQ